MTDIEHLFDTEVMRSAAHLELVRGSVTTAATLAHERTLPVDDALKPILPSGVMQRGSTMAVHGTGATSFALAMVGQAVRDGSFLAIVAPASFSLAACLDFDIPLRRVVQFVLPADGGDPKQWAQSVAAIVEGFDVVLLADRKRVSASHARQLTARNRERGSVLLRSGGPSWPDAADLRFDISTPEWSGLGRGHGHLKARRVDVQMAGRRYHGARRTHQLLLPAFEGGIALAPAVSLSKERFAGADIDAMLDVVDGGVGAGVSATLESAVEGTADAPDLNATA